MPVLAGEEFIRLNLMAGTAKSLEQELLNSDDAKIWDRDFNLLCDDLTKIVDPELGTDLRAERPFYDAAIQVAKGYFDKLPLGGLKAATGQFGFRLIAPQDVKTDAAGATPAYYSWAQTITMLTSNTYKNYALGASAHTAALYIRNASNKRAVMAFHRLISYKPSPRLIYVEMNINDYPYAPYSVEPYSKITKENKLFKIIPLPGRVILNPGGKFYIKLFFDNLSGESLEETFKVDIEVAPLGLIFGEYGYLASDQLK